MSKTAADIWKQNSIPVIYRPGGIAPVMIRLPYLADNRAWLQDGHRVKPKWNGRFKCWNIPKSWFELTIAKSLQRFGRIYVIQPYRVQKKCAPACWKAKGINCDCSCMGSNHGREDPAGKWRVISDTLAVQCSGMDVN